MSQFSVSPRKYLFLCTVLIIILHCCGVIWAGITPIPPNAKRFVTNKKNDPITSLERPPVITAAMKKSGKVDDSGVTFPPKSSSLEGRHQQQRRKTSGVLQHQKNSLGSLNLWKSFSRFQSAFTKMKNVLTGRRSAGVGTGRYMDGWMEGAMVPMTFLLMAAFIMDILQRLFPLPYATFVKEAYHKHGYLASASAAVAQKQGDQTRVNFNTPVGNLVLESTGGEKDKIFNLFGRSNQGNPGFESLPPTVSYAETPSVNEQGIDLNYLNSMFSVNESQPVTSSYIGVPILNNQPGQIQSYDGSFGVSPGANSGQFNNNFLTNPGSFNNGGAFGLSPGTNTGQLNNFLTNSFATSGNGGSFGFSDLAGGQVNNALGNPGSLGNNGLFSVANNGQSQEGTISDQNKNDTSPTTGLDASSSNFPYMDDSGYISAFTGSSPFDLSTSATDTSPNVGEIPSNMDESTNQIPLNSLDLLEYYSKLGDDGSPWTRRKRAG